MRETMDKGRVERIVLEVLNKVKGKHDYNGMYAYNIAQALIKDGVVFKDDEFDCPNCGTLINKGGDMNTIEQQILDVIDSIKRLSLCDARAKSIAITHLETALLWVIKSQERITTVN